MSTQRPPLPPFTVETAIEKVRLAEDGVMLNGVLEHTLYVGNDNYFTPDTSGLNQFFVVGLSDADLAAAGATFEAQQLPVPEPARCCFWACRPSDWCLSADAAPPPHAGWKSHEKSSRMLSDSLLSKSGSVRA